jgi:hypothetical protein
MKAEILFPILLLLDCQLSMEQYVDQGRKSVPLRCPASEALRNPVASTCSWAPWRPQTENHSE